MMSRLMKKMRRTFARRRRVEALSVAPALLDSVMDHPTPRGQFTSRVGWSANNRGPRVIARSLADCAPGRAAHGAEVPGMPILRLADVHLAYGHHPLLDGVDLVLEGRERVALVGRNGTGKSSLLRI